MTKSTLATALAATLACTAAAGADEQDPGGVFGNLRIGFIEAEDADGEHSSGSAIGGKLGYISPAWHGLRAGATFYTTQELFDDENGDFFDSGNDSYSILGEAFVQAVFGNTSIKAGRFEYDSPHADTDDIRMIPNTFQGASLVNNDLPDTTIQLTYLDKWAGNGADVPEEFEELNEDDGLAVLGVVYEGIDNVALQGWFYYGNDFAEWLYLEAVYETDVFSLGAQFASQSDETDDDSGTDGDAYGIFASVTYADVTVLAAYNDVSDTVTNGFGGGPYFTSADDFTIDGIEDQEAVALNVEYGGIDGLTLGVWHTDFDIGENETDYYAVYDVNDDLGFELIYTDQHDDGHFVRLITNYSF